MSFSHYCEAGATDKAFEILEDRRHASNSLITKEHALYFAIDGGQLKLSKQLIRAGANVNFNYNRAGFKKNLLELAVEKQNLEVLRLLIQNGFQVEHVDNAILFRVCDSTTERVGINILNVLVRGGINVKSRSCEGRIFLIEAIHEGSYGLVKNVLSKGVDVDITDGEKMTPLILSVYLERLDIVQLLLEYGANPNYGNAEKLGPLHVACTHGLFDIAKVLIEAGADVHLTFSNISAINFAVIYDHLDIVKLLVEHGALAIKEDDTPENDDFQNIIKSAVPLVGSILKNVAGGPTVNTSNLPDSEFAPLAEAIGKMTGTYIDPSEFSDILQDSLPQIQPLMNSMVGNLPQQVKAGFLKEFSAFTNAMAKPETAANIMQYVPKLSDITVANPLIYAANGGRIDILEYLLTQVDNVDLNPRKTAFVTPLTQACTNGEIEAMRLLLSKGANPNGPDHLNNPLILCLSSALTSGYHMVLPVVKLLLESGLNVKKVPAFIMPPIPNSEGILSQFSVAKHTQLTILLLTAGADQRYIQPVWNVLWMSTLVKDCTLRNDARNCMLMTLFGLTFHVAAIEEQMSPVFAMENYENYHYVLDVIKIAQQDTLSLKRISANAVRNYLRPNAFPASRELEIPKSLQYHLLDPGFM